MDSLLYIIRILAGVRLRLMEGVRVIAGVDESTGKVVPLSVSTSGSFSATFTGTERTPTITAVTSSGSVASGARALWFELSSDFEGTILGRAYTGAATSVVNIPVPLGDYLGAVAYTRSAGALYIFKAI